MLTIMVVVAVWLLLSIGRTGTQMIIMVMVVMFFCYFDTIIIANCVMASLGWKRLEVRRVRLVLDVRSWNSRVLNAVVWSKVDIRRRW